MNQKTISQPIAIGQLLSTIEGNQSPSYTLVSPLTAWACLTFIMADIVGNVLGLYGPTGWLVRLFPNQQAITLWVSPFLQIVALLRVVIPNFKKSRWRFSLIPVKGQEGTQGLTPAIIAFSGALVGLAIFGFMVYFASEKGMLSGNIWAKGKISSSNTSVYRMAEFLILVFTVGIIASLPLLFEPLRYLVKGGNGQFPPLLEVNYKDKPTRAMLLELDQQTLGTFAVFHKNHVTGQYDTANLEGRLLDVNVGNYLLVFPQMLQNSLGSSVSEIKSKGDFFICKARYIIKPSTIGISDGRFSPDSIKILREQLFQNTNLKGVFDNIIQRALDEYVDFGMGGIIQTEIDHLTATAITFKEVFQRLEGDARLAKAKAVSVSLPKDLNDLDGSALSLARTNLEKSVENLEKLRQDLAAKSKLWHPYRLRQRDARDNMASQFSARLLRDLVESSSATTNEKAKELTALLQFIGLKIEIISLDFSVGHAAECEQIVLRIEGIIVEELRQAQEQAESRLDSLLTEEKKRQDEFRIKILDLMKEFGPKYSSQIIEELLRLDDRSRNRALEYLGRAATQQEKEAYLNDIAPRNVSPSLNSRSDNPHKVDAFDVNDEV